MKRMLDHALYSALTRKWEKTAIETYSRAMKRREAATPAHVADVLQRIDAKATGLLTFVAMMIAGLGIAAPLVAEHPIEEAVVIAEICIYLLIAIGCLRCLSALNTPRRATDSASMHQHADRELIIRQELFQVCHRATIIFTVVVFISLPIMLVWRPE